ncbi:MAG: helix-turn-helix domain-containing protein [Bianqueaceae bacterium]
MICPGRGTLLPYPVIAAAVRGEPDAVNTVIRHYSGYIAALSTRTSGMISRSGIVRPATMWIAENQKRSPASPHER